MPLLDLPLESLKTYTGRNPRPADFDAYWNEALRELDATDPEVELIPNTTLSTRQAECFDLWFKGVGGARVHAQYLRPTSLRQQAVPALLQFHGYTANAGEWVEKLAYVSEGFCVAAMDCRGQGGLSEDRNNALGPTLQGHIVRGLEDQDPRKLFYRAIFLDTAQLARVVASFTEVDADRMVCKGGSQGGALALACAALEPRIRRCASQFPFLCDYQRVWEMDLAKDAYDGLRQYFRRRDPLHERQVEVFTRLGYIDCQHLAPRIRAQTLMLTGLMDPICPPSTQFAAYNKITAPKEMLVYPDFGHEALPGGDDRIFNFLTAED